MTSNRRHVPLPKGNVHKHKELVQDVTLGDLDAANARPQGDQDIMSVKGSLVKSGRIEVTEKLRREVHKVVQGYVEQGVAEVVPGVVFIDKVHMLDIECFTYSNALLESPMTPTVILATNHLLDRCMIVKTGGYTRDQVGKVVQVRAMVEGEKSSLRYALQLLTPALILARLVGRTQIELEDTGEMMELFLDAKMSTSGLGKGEELQLSPLLQLFDLAYSKRFYALMWPRTGTTTCCRHGLKARCASWYCLGERGLTVNTIPLYAHVVAEGALEHRGSIARFARERVALPRSPWAALV
ncbi:TIP49 C-terminus-domain-containing protein [Russula compacta]|nr:TIP49 C-terminus-domain-containing protein [Russula compacta]